MDNKNHEIGKDEAFEILKDFGIYIQRSRFYEVISKLSSIKRVRYDENDIYFESDIAYIKFTRNDSRGNFKNRLYS